MLTATPRDLFKTFINITYENLLCNTFFIELYLFYNNIFFLRLYAMITYKNRLVGYINELGEAEVLTTFPRKLQIL